jgi:hypothetical protein
MDVFITAQKQVTIFSLKRQEQQKCVCLKCGTFKEIILRKFPVGIGFVGSIRFLMVEF